MRSSVRHIILLCFLLVTFIGCGSSGLGGTSIANPPTLPVNSYSPDVDDNVTQTAITSTDASSDETALFLSSDSYENDDASLYLTGPSSEFGETFLTGPIHKARRIRKQFEIFGQNLAAQVRSAGVTSLTGTISVDMNDVVLGGITLDLNIRISQREDFIRVLLINSKTDRLIGYYLFSTDSSGNPEKGVFVLVNRNLFTVSASAGVRMFILAYDFTDSSSNRMTLTLDIFDTNAGHFVIQHISYQCDESTNDCLGEFTVVDTSPPQRALGARSVRFGWNDTSRQICLANISYSNGPQLGETQRFTGPAIPGDDDVESGTCQIGTPFWNDNDFTVARLPGRFSDDNDGGFSSRLFGSDSSSDLDSAITSTTIENWLGGRF